MTIGEAMQEIREIKERIGRRLEGKSDEEVLAYFRDNEPEWAKRLPRLEKIEPIGRKDRKTDD